MCCLRSGAQNLTNDLNATIHLKAGKSKPAGFVKLYAIFPENAYFIIAAVNHCQIRNYRYLFPPPFGVTETRHGIRRPVRTTDKPPGLF